jgi:hypothetical protein
MKKVSKKNIKLLKQFEQNNVKPKPDINSTRGQEEQPRRAK